jgi:hypothetical protein
MRSALELETKTADNVRQLADAQKPSIEQLLIAYVPGLAPEESNKNGVEVDDKARAFEEWAASSPGDPPPLSAEAIGRASIYRDR